MSEVEERSLELGGCNCSFHPRVTDFERLVNNEANLSVALQTRFDFFTHSLVLFAPLKPQKPQAKASSNRVGRWSRLNSSSLHRIQKCIIAKQTEQRAMTGGVDN